VSPEGNSILLNLTGAGSLSSYAGPGGALLGVFWDETTSNDTAHAPPTLDFLSGTSRNFDSIEPLPGQIFFVGDARTTNGTTQKFYAPNGATRLYFGIADGVPTQPCFALYMDNTEDPSFPFHVCVTPVFTPTSPTSSGSPTSLWISTSPTLSPSLMVNRTVLNSVLSHSSITKATTTRTPSKTSNRTFDFVTYAHYSLSNLDADQLQNAVEEIQPINYRFTNKGSGGEVVLRLKSAHVTDSTGRPLVIGALTIPPKLFRTGVSSLFRPQRTRLLTVVAPTTTVVVMMAHC